MDLHGQCMSEATSHRGLGSAEFVGPAYSGSVVTPGCHVDVSENGKMLQY